MATGRWDTPSAYGAIPSSGYGSSFPTAGSLTTKSPTDPTKWTIGDITSGINTYGRTDTLPQLPSTNLPNPAGSTVGHWDYPDYASLLQKWMAPYQQQYQGNMAALKAQADYNRQIAQERYSTGATSTLEQIKRQEAYGAFRHGLTTEQAQHQHDINLRTIVNSLAARGALSSGERDYQNAEEAWRFANLSKGEQEQYKQQQYGYQVQRSNAANQLLDYLHGIQQAYADAQRQGLSGLAEQQQSIANTLAGIYRPTWVDESQGVKQPPEFYAPYASNYPDFAREQPGIDPNTGMVAGIDPATHLPNFGSWGLPGVNA